MHKYNVRYRLELDGNKKSSVKVFANNIEHARRLAIAAVSTDGMVIESVARV